MAVFRAGDLATDVVGYDDSNAGRDQRNSWFRCNNPSLMALDDAVISENTNENWFAVIDAQHAHAQVKGLQAVSQFGHGDYTLEFQIIPRPTTAGDTSEAISAQIQVEYVPATSLRYAALANLKDLERKNAQALLAIENAPGGQLNPLLTANVDGNPMYPADGTSLQGSKGTKMVRFSYNLVPVYANDRYMVDINADGDFSDAHEEKFYTLMEGEGAHRFSVLARKEGAVNPANPDGEHITEQEWHMPLSVGKVHTSTKQRGWVSYSQNGSTGAVTNKSCYFKVENALGGLIQVTMPIATSSDDGILNVFNNNDFSVWCNLTCHRWTPMKR